MTDLDLDLISPHGVLLDQSYADASAVITALVGVLAADGRVTDQAGVTAAVLDREAETGGTGMESGIAIPHTKHAGVRRASVAFARVPGGVDFGAPDAPADLVFLIAAPQDANDTHLTVLSKLARKLVHDEFRRSLRDAAGVLDIVSILKGELE